MKSKRALTSSRFFIILLTLLLAASLFFELEPLDALEHQLLGRMFHFRQKPAEHPVIVVKIDNESIAHLGSWPWPRSTIADMIHYLSQAGAHTIGVELIYAARVISHDISAENMQNFRREISSEKLTQNKNILARIDGFLLESERKLAADSQIVRAVQAAHNVVLPIRFDDDKGSDHSPGKLSPWLRMQSLPSQSVFGDNAENTDPLPVLSGILAREAKEAKGIRQPYSELSTKAGGLGHINFEADEDGTVRAIPLIIGYQGRKFIAFALQTAMKYMGLRLGTIALEETGVRVEHLFLPTDPGHRMLIDYGRVNENIHRYSFHTVLNGDIPADTFHQKIVLIGLTAADATNLFKTPLRDKTAGVEISAIAVENIVNRLHISRPPWTLALEISTLLYFCFFLLFVIPKVTPKIGILILGVFGISWLAAAILMFAVQGYWLRMIAPILLAILGFSLTGRKGLEIEKQAERAALYRELGLSLQGQGMLDKAFEKFMKCPIEDVATRELMYNLGLDFERKRMFNKALAVYQHISKAGPFKDISDRITGLKQISTSFSLPRNTGQNGGLSLQSTKTKPTLGRYEILQELGRGAMGVVYLGNDPSINRHVAIKTLNYADIEPDQLDEVKTRFFREAEAAGNLSHPHIVTIYDAGEDHDMAYIAMELLQGTELTAHCRKENALPIQRILPIITAVAEALGYAHRQGVVHRDIKPANIILRQADQVKVTDFGIARVISSSKTQTGIIFGTPSYMSPEQAAGKKVDGRSDIFSLGIVFYELLCLTKPFKGDSIAGLMAAISNSDYTPIADIMPETPPCCMDIVDKLLAKFLTKRFQSADRVVEAIQDCQAQLQR